MVRVTGCGENWNRAYFEAPEVFDAFCSAEDPDGLISRSIRAHAALEGGSVLEIGCGTGRYTREWALLADRYVALERSPRMLALARRHCGDIPNGLDFVCADAARLPLAGDTVDRVLAGWVVVNLRPAVRRRVLDETKRVLRRRPGAGLWLVENHWSGEFQQLRGRRSEVDRARVRDLIEEQAFSEREVVKTELRFPSSDEAERVLGWLCGEGVRRKLRERPVARLTHHVVILNRPAE